MLIGPLPSIGWPTALTTRPISIAHRHQGDAARAAHHVALLDRLVLTHHDDTDVLYREVQGDAQHALLGELDQLPAITLVSPDTTAMPSPTSMTSPTSIWLRVACR